GKACVTLLLFADRPGRFFKARFLLPSCYFSSVRADRRRTLRQLVDGAVKGFESSPSVKLLDSTFDQAYTLMSSTRAREAFDLGKEPDKVKDRFGRNRFGMSCLLARRLIEAGVRFVTVNMFETVFNE